MRANRRVRVALIVSEVPPCPRPSLPCPEVFVLADAADADTTADAVYVSAPTVDEFGVCVLFVSCLCLFRVYVSGRAFIQAVSLRGSGFFQ